MNLISVVRKTVLTAFLLPLTCHADTLITGVSFTGEFSNPTITIEGSGFGAPPVPTTIAYPGFTGYDFGTDLYFEDFAPTAGLYWGAGRGVELTMRDLIGLNVIQYTDSEIILTLGSTYSLYYYPLGIYEMNSGDGYRIVVKDASYTGTIPTPEPGPIVAVITGLLPLVATRLNSRRRRAQTDQQEP